MYVRCPSVAFGAHLRVQVQVLNAQWWTHLFQRIHRSFHAQPCQCLPKSVCTQVGVDTVLVARRRVGIETQRKKRGQGWRDQEERGCFLLD